jgi:hypothetical protein
MTRPPCPATLCLSALPCTGGQSGRVQGATLPAEYGQSPAELSRVHGGTIEKSDLFAGNPKDFTGLPTEFAGF